MIVLNGATEIVPDRLYAQLGEGGRLVGVFAMTQPPRATIVTRSHGDFGNRALFDAAVPVLPGLERVAGLRFLGHFGLCRAFRSLTIRQNSFPNQKCGPIAPRPEFPPRRAAGCSVTPMLRTKVSRDSLGLKRRRLMRSSRRTRMNGFPGMRGVKVFTGAAAAVLLLACMGPTPALADTIEAALVRAYQNNPQLNAQRARSDHRRERAAGFVRLSPARRGHRQRRLPIYRYAQHSGRHVHRPRAAPDSRRQCAAQRRRYRLADPVQRPADREQDPRRGEPGFGGARRLARAGTDRAAVGRHHLHGLSARLRDRRGSEEQRPRSRTDAEADQGPLQRRRGHAHRRRAVGSAACRRQDPAADRRIQPDHHARRTSAASSATSR